MIALARRRPDNLLGALEKSKSRDLASFLYALGIPNSGKTTTKVLADHYRSLPKIMAATPEELITLPDVGGIVAESIYSFFRDPVMVSSIERMLAAGVNPIAEEPAVVLASPDNPFFGKTVVLTGTLSTMGRDECAKKLEALELKLPAAFLRKRTSLLQGKALAAS